MFIRYNWPGMVWILVILFLTLIPGNYIPRKITFWEWIGPDKILHIAIFGILSFMVIRGLKKQYRFPFLRYYSVSIAIIFGIILGLLTEVTQKFIFIGRNANMFDLIANGLGCFAGWGAFCIINGNLKGKSKELKN